MSNEENWQIANTYSSTFLLVSGILLTVLGFLCVLLIKNNIILSVITVLAGLATAGTVLIFTERRLK